MHVADLTNHPVILLADPVGVDLEEMAASVSGNTFGPTTAVAAADAWRAPGASWSGAVATPRPPPEGQGARLAWHALQKQYQVSKLLAQ